MRYLGGKHRQGPTIARFANSLLEKTGVGRYCEPFMGALGVARHVHAPRMLLADQHGGIVSMWKALLGEDPPELPLEVSEEEYRSVRNRNDLTDWLTAYVAFGMSFGGKEWGGYARDARDGRIVSARHSAVRLRDSMLLMMAAMRGKRLTIRQSDYARLKIPDGWVVYLDPPYANRTRQSRFDFDSDAFWEWAEKLSSRCYVVVTEFVVPDGWTALHSFGDTVIRHHAAKTKGDGTLEILAVRGLAEEVLMP